MINRRPLLTCLCSFAILWCFAGPSYGQKRAASNLSIVEWCDLVRTPKKFSGKLIRLHALLVENHNPNIIDGADPQLYSAQCLDITFTTTVRWLGSSYEANSARHELDDARKTQDRFFVSRAEVVLIGKFKGPHKRSYFDPFDSEFQIRDVESAILVSPDAPWPKWMDDILKKHSITTRSTGAAGACFASSLVRRG